MVLTASTTALGEGYGGEINILVGLEDEETIKGIYVVSHSERWGDWKVPISEDFFTDQFIGLKIDEGAGWAGRWHNEGDTKLLLTLSPSFKRLLITCYP